MTKDPRRRERREDSIIAKIAVPLLVGILLALAVGGTSPWWWSVVFPTPSPAIGQHSSPVVTPTPPDETVQPETGVPSSVADSPTPETESPPPPTEPLTFLEQLAGEWTFDTWQERPGPVTLNFEPLSGSLHVDAFGHAYWDLDLDDGGPPPPITPGLRCTGVVDTPTETLASWTGKLDVDGNDVITTERDWTSNLRSLPGDAHVAFCGAAGFFPQLFVYDTDRSDYTLAISTAADAAKTRLLTMRNAAGTFTWKKEG
jgi:hypothetical protein